MSKIEEKTDIIRDIDINILRNFRYSEDVIFTIKESWNIVLDYLQKKLSLKIKLLEEALEIYYEDLRKSYIFRNNKHLLIVKLFSHIKPFLNPILRKNKMKISDVNYDFPMEYNHIVSKKVKGYNVKANYTIIDANLIISDTVKYEKQINVIKYFFNYPSMSNNEVKEVINQFNQAIMKSYDIMAHYFIKDVQHSVHLDEVISFQEKVEAILDQIVGSGGMDTTRDITAIMKTLLTPLGFKNEDVTLTDVFGKQLAFNEYEERFNFPIKLAIDKTVKMFEDTKIKKLIIAVEKELDTRGINYKKVEDRYEFDMKYPVTDVKDILRIAINKFNPSLKNNQRFYLTGLLYNHNGIYEYNEYSDKAQKNSYPLSFMNIYWNIDNLFSKITNKGFRINNIGKMMKVIEKYLKIKICLSVNEIEENGKKELKKRYEKIKLITITDNPATLEIRIFDLVKYFEDLSFEIHDFFITNLNLKAILQRKKYTEKWNGTRGFLDVGATVRHSLSKGWIQPMQTYRKQQIEDDPIFFINYDISGSMRSVTRITQFLTILLMSFFDRGFRKLWLGYIGTVKRGSGANHLYPSELRHKDGGIKDQRKKRRFDYKGEKSPFHRIQKETETNLSFHSTLGEVINDYFDFEFERGLRDFLDCQYSGGSGTRLDVFFLMKNHPDLDMRGLKYVLLVTDAQIYSSERVDLARTAISLVRRPDVKFFFLWITSWGGTGDRDNFEPDSKYHFVTRAEIGRVLYSKMYDIDGNKRTNLQEGEKNDIEFYQFVYEYWDNVYIVTPDDVRFVGEIKHMIKKLESIDFFIP